MFYISVDVSQAMQTRVMCIACLVDTAEYTEGQGVVSLDDVLISLTQLPTHS